MCTERGRPGTEARLGCSEVDSSPSRVVRVLDMCVSKVPLTSCIITLVPAHVHQPHIQHTYSAVISVVACWCARKCCGPVCQGVSVPGAGFTRLCFSHVMTLVANNCLLFSTVSFPRRSYQRLDITGVTIHSCVHVCVCVQVALNLGTLCGPLYCSCMVYSWNSIGCSGMFMLSLVHSVAKRFLPFFN